MQEWKTPLSDRRTFLRNVMMSGAALAVQQLPTTDDPARRLGQAARSGDHKLGVFWGAHNVQTDPVGSKMIADNFALIADGNDLKFSDRLRPTPDTFNFTAGDIPVNWAQENHLLFRGHNLVWWNGLPKWFPAYVNSKNAKEVMVGHIQKVVGHYKGRVYSWDVVNEPIYHDGRPDQLRRRPWLDFMGPEYIDIAFQTAHEADPSAKLVLNECYIEHDTPGEQGRRAGLLALAVGLKQRGVPITHVGVQGHLRGTVPIDKTGMTTFMKKLNDAGIEVMVTELDVDDTGIPGPQVAQAVADKYAEFLDVMAPHCKIITLEDLTNDPNLPKRSDGLSHAPNLFTPNHTPTHALDVVTRTLQQSRFS
jgi:endo-1,4-beta-xylanase